MVELTQIFVGNFIGKSRLNGSVRNEFVHAEKRVESRSTIFVLRNFTFRWTWSARESSSVDKFSAGPVRPVPRRRRREKKWCSSSNSRKESPWTRREMERSVSIWRPSVFDPLVKKISSGERRKWKRKISKTRPSPTMRNCHSRPTTHHRCFFQCRSIRRTCFSTCQFDQSSVHVR